MRGRGAHDQGDKMRRGLAILVLAASVAAEPFALVGLREDTRPAKDGALRVGLDFLMPDGTKHSRSILIRDAVIRREQRQVHLSGELIEGENRRRPIQLVRQHRHHQVIYGGLGAPGNPSRRARQPPRVGVLAAR